MKKDLKALIQAYRDKGWVIEKTNSQHWRFRGPRGELVHTSSTPSDWRAFQNMKAQLNREERRVAA